MSEVRLGCRLGRIDFESVRNPVVKESMTEAYRSEKKDEEGSQNTKAKQPVFSPLRTTKYLRGLWGVSRNCCAQG